MRGMTEYQEAESEARREASRTGVASMSEPGAGAVEEHPVWRTRHALPGILEPLLLTASPVRRRPEKDLRLKIQPGCLK